MYKCPTCGAGLVFEPKTQKLLCLSCRNQYDPENIEKMRLDQAKEVNNDEKIQDEYEAVSYKCSHCGAELITTDETITTFCSFCRTGTMLDRKTVKKRKPDYVIPFKITKKECEEIYINRIKNAVFAPKSMIDTQEVEKIRGIYMPYWIYSFEKHGEDSTKGQKYSHRSGDYVYYDDYTLTTNVNAECSGITHDATADFSDRLSESIAPFSVEEKKDFSPAYLSGYYADNEDVDDKTYLNESHDIVSKHISKELGKDKEYHKYSAKPKVTLEQQSAKLALFPIYFIATKNRMGDRISYAVINGQTGKIAADIPIDFKKFAIFSTILAIIIFIILNLFVSFSMPKLIMSSIVFNIGSLFLLKKQNQKIINRENEIDDKGIQYKKHRTENNTAKTNTQNNYNGSLTNTIIISIAIIIGLPILYFLGYALGFSTLFKHIGIAIIPISLLIMIIRKMRYPDKDISLYKPLLGLLITIVVFCIRPASDIYYYIAALISISITMWSFYDIIKKLNILSTRKLPQLGKRGGDENA